MNFVASARQRLIDWSPIPTTSLLQAGVGLAGATAGSESSYWIARKDPAAIIANVFRVFVNMSSHVGTIRLGVGASLC
jgi:hypothetical protein